MYYLTPSSLPHLILCSHHMIDGHQSGPSLSHIEGNAPSFHGQTHTNDCEKSWAQIQRKCTQTELRKGKQESIIFSAMMVVCGVGMGVLRWVGMGVRPVAQVDRTVGINSPPCMTSLPYRSHDAIVRLIIFSILLRSLGLNAQREMTLSFTCICWRWGNMGSL